MAQPKEGWTNPLRPRERTTRPDPMATPAMGSINLPELTMADLEGSEPGQQGDKTLEPIVGIPVAQETVTTLAQMQEVFNHTMGHLVHILNASFLQIQQDMRETGEVV
jgi:hypothetical protein